jgi:hypothetical protein
MSATSIWRLLLRGLGWGIAASLVGSLVFGAVGFLATLVMDVFTYPIDISKELSVLPQDIQTMLLFPLNLILFGILFSLIPSVVGGVALAGLVQYLGPSSLSERKA